MDYDIVVIGGGSAGLFAVSVANTLGAKTCLIEKNKLGGDCTWFGCIPSKTILKSAHIAQQIRNHSYYGLKLTSGPDIDTTGVLSYVREVRSKVYSHETPEVFEKRGIKVITGTPHFLTGDTIQVNNQKIKAGKFIICTGGHAVIPPVKGLKDIPFLTNETIFELDKLPSTLITLGGGPIGVELSQALNRLGVKVTLVQRRDRILPREEPELSRLVQNKLTAEGINILTDTDLTGLSRKDTNIHATIKNKDGSTKEISGQAVLVAAGRTPNIEGLALDNAGVEHTPKGIKTNAHLQTTNTNIFACGDVVGPYLFTHVAAYMASVCVRNALFKKITRQKVNYSNMTWCTFTDPELAHLGLTEQEARQQNKKIKVYNTSYNESDRAVTDQDTDGWIKIITDKKDRLLGAHIAGSKAGELMQGFLLAKSQRVPVTRIARTLYAYPTLAELIKKTSAKPLVDKRNNPFIKIILKLLKA